MILSITVYTLVGVMLFYFGWHYNKRFSLPTEYHTIKQFLLSWEIIASFVLFSVITGLRYHTGWDHEYYIQDYVQYQNEGTLFRPDFEPGFRLIETIFAKLGFHYSIFFGFLGFVNIFFIYFALRKNKEVIPWVGLLIMLGPYFLHLVNSLRQGIVECVFVSMIVLVNNRRYLLLLLCSLLLVSIHKVALLIIPILILAKFLTKFENNKHLFVVYITCFVIGQFPILISWTINGFSDVLALFGYHKYVHLFNTNSQYAFHRSSFGVISIALIVVHLFMIYYYSKLREYYKGNKFLTICSSLSLIYVCYFVLVMNTSFYFKRPNELLLPFMVITTAFLIVYLFKRKRFLQLALFCSVNFSVAPFSVFKVGYLGLSDSTDFFHFIPFC